MIHLLKERFCVIFSFTAINKNAIKCKHVRREFSSLINVQRSQYVLKLDRHNIFSNFTVRKKALKYIYIYIRKYVPVLVIMVTVLLISSIVSLAALSIELRTVDANAPRLNMFHRNNKNK